MTEFQNKLKIKIDEYVHFVYNLTRQFPKEELYGSVSQWRKSSLSVILNYIEGYARKKSLVHFNFLEISYGSLKESKYLLYFSKKENFISQDEYNKGIAMADEIGAMLWKEISDLERSIKN